MAGTIDPFARLMDLERFLIGALWDEQRANMMYWRAYAADELSQETHDAEASLIAARAAVALLRSDLEQAREQCVMARGRR